MLQAFKHKGVMVAGQLQVYLGLKWRSEMSAWSKLWQRLPLWHKVLVAVGLVGTLSSFYLTPTLLGHLIDGLSSARGLGVVLNDLQYSVLGLGGISVLFLWTQKYFHQYEGPAYATLISAVRLSALLGTGLWGIIHGWFLEVIFILFFTLTASLKNTRPLIIASSCVSLALMVVLIQNNLSSVASRAVTLGEGVQIISWLFIFSTIIFERCLNFFYRNK